ncbi:hypothetical protein A2U01_0062673, partial [Trifolium medium]|nr:hypothetical protein [Trifolium medium]
AVSLEGVNEFIQKAGGLQYIPFADEDDFMDYANVDVGRRQGLEEELQHELNQDVPNAPEMERFPAPTFDLDRLSDMLWRMDLSTQAGVDMVDSYDTFSPFWQAMMARREQVPAYFYP